MRQQPKKVALSTLDGPAQPQTTKPILMRNFSGLLLFLSLYPPPGRAQSPRVAGVAPMASVGLGYSYTNIAIPSSSARIALNGLDAAFTLDISTRLGARVDVGYVRASDVLNSGHHSDVLSYLAGPVFYPVRRRKLAIFVQGLLGAARVTGSVPGSGGGFLTGYVNQFAWAAGTGAEFRISESIGVRIGADYLHTRLFNSSTAIRGQDNLRITGSLVYFFGRRMRR